VGRGSHGEQNGKQGSLSSLTEWQQFPEAPNPALLSLLKPSGTQCPQRMLFRFLSGPESAIPVGGSDIIAIPQHMSVALMSDQ
jgi:hypothetical protein